MSQKSFLFINTLAALIVVIILIVTECNKEDEPPVFNLALSVSPQQSGTVDGAVEYEEGETVVLSATPDEGNEFVYWTDQNNDRGKYRCKLYLFNAL